MTYAITEDNGTTWLAKGQPRPTTANGKSPPREADLAVDGVYLEVYPDPGSCEGLCCASSVDPVLTGGEAVYQEVRLSDEDCAGKYRSIYISRLKDQIPILTITDEAADSTTKAKAEQWQSKYKAALEALSNTADVDLPAFDSILANHQSSVQDYGANLANQESRSLRLNDEAVADGWASKYTGEEVIEMDTRIANNRGVATGTQTAVMTPSKGAPRESIALEDEVIEKAVCKEVTFFWAPNTYYMPQVTIPSIPEGQDTSKVICMIYDENNVYRSWTPFTQQEDGTWVSRADTHDTSTAKTESSNWRVAVSLGGASAEQEVTNRMYLVPPQVADSDVRFGGRT